MVCGVVYGKVWSVVWCGVVWCGVVWYGMVWYGMVWYGMVWYGMVWYGMVWYGMVWYGMVWYGMVWWNIKSFFFSIRSFHFNDMRIDEALRSFLETFRLPGEAPVIQHLLEHFSEGYFVSAFGRSLQIWIFVIHFLKICSTVYDCPGLPIHWTAIFSKIFSQILFLIKRELQVF